MPISVFQYMPICTVNGQTSLGRISEWIFAEWLKEADVDDKIRIPSTF